MSRIVKSRLKKLEEANKNSNKMYAILTFENGDKKVLKSMNVPFVWLCGCVADSDGRKVIDIEILPDGRREHSEALEIIQQLLRG